MKKKIYEKLITPVGKYSELKLLVDYTLGGPNYFSGEYNKRGIYLYLTPVTREASCESSTLMGSSRESGYKICLETLARRSQKKIDNHFEKIKLISKRIASLYSKEENQKIFKLVNN